jgi:uncharacterized protein (DUF302 family)
MKITHLLTGLALSVGVLYATAPASAQSKTEGMLTAKLNGSQGNQEAAIDTFMKKKIGTVGFSIVKANRNIENFYYEKYKERNVEMISFYDIANLNAIRPLLLQNPDFGAYTPFNFLVFKTLDKKSDDNTWYGHLAPDTMLDIIGEKDPKAREAFTKMLGDLDALVQKELKPTKFKEIRHAKPLPERGLNKLVMKFETPDDLEEFVENFVMKHDEYFTKHNFIIAGFIDLKFEYSDRDLDFEKYDAYWVSLLCHFQFSNSIFNHGMPEAGLFAPCSVYFYIPKGKNELHVGYASVDNWINALEIKDEKRIKYMRAIDAEVVQTFEELGFTKEN